MGGEAVLKKMYEKRKESEKGQVLKELKAIMLTTIYPREREYLKRAIDYIERN